jgi:hypothetical protein
MPFISGIFHLETVEFRGAQREARLNSEASPVVLVGDLARNG